MDDTDTLTATRENESLSTIRARYQAVHDAWKVSPRGSIERVALHAKMKLALGLLREAMLAEVVEKNTSPEKHPQGGTAPIRPAQGQRLLASQVGSRKREAP